MSLNVENHLLNIAKEIVIVTDVKGEEKLNDSVIVVTGKILELNREDFRFLRNWFEEKTGENFEIPRRSIEIRNVLRDFLISKGITVPKAPKYEIEQSSFRTSEDFFKEWNSSSDFLSKKR